ncbi:MAG: hypothetical protein R3C97_14880 [Geminicoccaceae bacterium]
MLVVANRAPALAVSETGGFRAQVSTGPSPPDFDRAIYDELAYSGLGVFDLDAARVQAARDDWVPLISAIEEDA